MSGLWSPGRVRRHDAASSVAPIEQLSGLLASLSRIRRSHPDRRTSSCESFLEFSGAVTRAQAERERLPFAPGVRLELLQQGHLGDDAADRQDVGDAGRDASLHCRRVLARLVDERLLVRLDRRVGGVRAGSASFV